MHDSNLCIRGLSLLRNILIARAEEEKQTNLGNQLKVPEGWVCFRPRFSLQLFSREKKYSFLIKHIEHTLSYKALFVHIYCRNYNLDLAR
jgi:hypothetical protein